jgi:alkane 1-monooxygenase
MTLATSSPTASPADKGRLNAWPYWMTLTFVPLVVLAVLYGGWVILLIPIYGWVLMPLLDVVLGKDLRNPDPDTPDAELFWFRLLTCI